MKNKSGLIIGIAVLIIVSLACGGSDTGEKVGESGETSVPDSPKVEVYKVGDIIQAKDHTIILNSATLQGSALRANFSIENLGAEEIVVSSIMSFDAKDSDGVVLEMDWFDCGTQLDGTVLPGDKLKGDICWSGATTTIAKIYYKTSLLSSGAVVWEVTE